MRLGSIVRRLPWAVRLEYGDGFKASNTIQSVQYYFRLGRKPEQWPYPTSEPLEKGRAKLHSAEGKLQRLINLWVRLIEERKFVSILIRYRWSP